MQTVYKYQLGRTNNNPVEVKMPEGAVVIHCDYDPVSNQFCVWAVVLNDVHKTELRTFYVGATGSDLARNLKGDEEMQHLNTFKAEQDGAVLPGWFHAFEVLPAAAK